MSGRFEYGRVPPESKLASLLAVSRTTVRVALQRRDEVRFDYLSETLTSPLR
jgi:DNA-binding FadR family transcriptional regulator